MSTLQSDNSMNSHCIGRATKRLHNEYKKFIESPPENIKVAFQEDLILEWHFLFTGLSGTPFKGGEYHGVLIFPEDYPFSPPSIRFNTPNGRFKTNERICFDLSDFHPECWKPACTVSAVLQGVYSFMMNETTDTVGSLNVDEGEIKELAGKSREFNLQDSSAELFHNETKDALTGNSDANQIPSPTNKEDISSSRKDQSDSSTDLSEPFVSSKEAKPNKTTDTVGNLGMDTNIIMRLASKSRKSDKKVDGLIDLFGSQTDNVKSPSSENMKLATRLQSKPLRVIAQPSKSTQTADQVILHDPVIVQGNNSTVSSESISDPTQRSYFNDVNNGKELQGDNITSTSEPPEDSKHLPQQIVKSSKTQTKRTSNYDIPKNRPNTASTTNVTPHPHSLAPAANDNPKESGIPLRQGSKNDSNLQTGSYLQKMEKSLHTTDTSQNKNLKSVDLSRMKQLDEKGKKSTATPEVLRLTLKDRNNKSKS